MNADKGSQRYLPRIRIRRNQQLLFQETLEDHQTFRIGSALHNNFTLSPEVDISSHKLFEWNKDVLTVHLTDELGGWLFTGGRKQPLSDLLLGARSLRLPLDVNSYGMIQAGTFEVQFEYSYELSIPRSRFSIREAIENLDWALLFFVLPLLLLQIGFSAYIAMTPPPPPVEEKKLDYELTQNQVRLQLPPKPPEAPKVVKQEAGGSKTPKGKPKRSRAASAKPGPPKPAPATAPAPKTMAVEKVRNTGLLALMGAKSGSNAVGKLLSGSNLNAIDGALGKVMRQGDVSAALGQVAKKFKEGDVKHFGIGSVDGIGGGSAVVLGNAQDAEVVIGGGGGDGEGFGEGGGEGTGVGTGKGGGKGPGVGGYDINGAKRVIYRNIGALKYCYERALKEDPSLGGSYMLEFTVLTSGFPERRSMKLLGAEGSPELMSCITGRFSRLQFPKPKGFEVTIRYPVNFRSGQ